MEQLEGKVSVITGGGSGIGAGIARACAKAGMKVAVADIRLSEAERIRDELIASGADAIAVATDVSELASIRTLADEVEKTFGAVHLICNNAGVSVRALMQEADIKDWQWLINVNLYGVIHGVKVFLPKLAAQGEGHIVNTASMGGLIAGPPSGLYCVTKFAVVGLSEALLVEVADKGIGVSVLCPGLVKTNIYQSSEQVRPEALKTGKKYDVIGHDVASGIDPNDVGQRVVDAVIDNELYIITHNDYREFIKMRSDNILEAIDRHAERYGR
jgi:NAD(P)-dependent dehydrogenase (short-subunit alcohol dehydrogenase family)